MLPNIRENHQMTRRTFLILSGTTTLYSLSGCKHITSSNSQTSSEKIYAFYGDTLENRIVAIDVENMKLLSSTYTEGDTPYTIGRAGDEDKFYAITRGSNACDVLDIHSRKLIKRIPLEHSPRSCAFNQYNNLQLISGKNKPMSSLVDVKTDTVIAVVGRNTTVNPLDYGGSNATGHPIWIDTNTFALLDREIRQIVLYRVFKNETQWEVIPLHTLDTPTAVHHFIGRGPDAMNNGLLKSDTLTDTFYAVTEGTADNTPGNAITPSIIKIKYKNDSLSIIGETHLPKESWGAHHATFTPDNKNIYLGLASGVLFIINKDSMEIVKSVNTGKGCGHTTFIPQKNLAVVTNHHDTFISIIDMTTQNKIADITVSGPKINNTILQSHTSFTDLSGNFFYAFATDNGKFYEVDLNTLKVTRTLYTGGTPKQGCHLLRNIYTDKYSRIQNSY